MKNIATPINYKNRLVQTLFMLNSPDCMCEYLPMYIKSHDTVTSKLSGLNKIFTAFNIRNVLSGLLVVDK